MYRGLYVDKPQSVLLREEQELPLQPHQVRIRTRFAAIKHGTEFHIFSGESPFQERIFDTRLRLFVKQEQKQQAEMNEQYFVGNMVAGTVAETGEEARRFQVGELVYAYGPACELVTKAEDEVEPLVSSMSPLDALCLDPAFYAFAAVRDCGARLGDDVVVFGLGAIGLFVVQMLHLCGCGHIIAVDPIEKRRERARGFGADLLIDPTVEDAGLAVREFLGSRGADVAIEASGHYNALAGAIRSVRNCARIVTLGYYKGRDHILELGAEWHHNRLELISSMPVWDNPSREYPLWDKQRISRSLIAMFVKKQLRSEGIIDPLVNFSEAPMAFLEIYHNPANATKLGIVFPSQERV